MSLPCARMNLLKLAISQHAELLKIIENHWKISEKVQISRKFDANGLWSNFMPGLCNNSYKPIRWGVKNLCWKALEFGEILWKFDRNWSKFDEIWSKFGSNLMEISKYKPFSKEQFEPHHPFFLYELLHKPGIPKCSHKMTCFQRGSEAKKKIFFRKFRKFRTPTRALSKRALRVQNSAPLANRTSGLVPMESPWYKLSIIRSAGGAKFRRVKTRCKRAQKRVITVPGAMPNWMTAPDSNPFEFL